MFDIQTQLFEGRDIRFGPIDHEKDPEIESKWTHDSEFIRLMEVNAARPMSAAILKKQYEKIEKQVDDDKNFFYFAIRAKEDDRLIGKALIQSVEWTNAYGWIHLGIGSAENRRKGYGSQALTLLLRFAFAELNLFRVSARVPEYNEAGIALFTKFHFVEEVRQRQALERDGRRWDILIFGLLISEWQNDTRPDLNANEGK
ncbi:MAG TPA: GNAT family protein [Anaerolineales bacterium]|nr:GNAT family protein [Anaerolineales bacterium]